MFTPFSHHPPIVLNKREVFQSFCPTQSISQYYFTDALEDVILVSVNRVGTVKIFSHALSVNWLRAWIGRSFMFAVSVIIDATKRGNLNLRIQTAKEVLFYLNIVLDDLFSSKIISCSKQIWARRIKIRCSYTSYFGFRLCQSHTVGRNSNCNPSQTLHKDHKQLKLNLHLTEGKFLLSSSPIDFR